ncbi:MAG: sulfatase [Deltaproteobacteria bacterium]|nr:sulfatase [Deltaproteobacteria bacterium]
MPATNSALASMKRLRRSPERAARPPLASHRLARRGLAVLPVLLALWACEKSAPPQDVRAKLRQIERPNVVLILVDALRADWTTPYGFDAEVSPELQRWADRGVVFERVLAQSSWTKVSMASLFTSLWSRSHAIRLPSDGLSEGALTLADVLKSAGYRTYAVQSNGWLDQSFGFHQGFDHYVFPSAMNRAVDLGSSSVWPHGERIFEEAKRLIDAHSAGSPFFLYLHFMDVHEYAAPPEFRNFGGGQEGTYLAAIRWVDDVVERLRRKLERDGFGDSTVMILASDHGEAFGENRSRGHARNVFTPVLHVPLVLRFPFPMEPMRVPTQVRNLDIAPTVMDIAGLAIPEGFEGESLLPLIAAPDPQPDRPSFAALGAPILRGVVEQVSVNDGSWSLARNLDERGREFLFERALDPLEDANLVDLERAAAQRMRAVLDAHLSVEARAEARATNVRIDPNIAERLRAMGYLQ